MNFIYKLEKKFGRYAIPNVTLYLILLYGIGYVLQLVNPEVMSLMSLDFYQILFHGQVWRIVTWLMVPPSDLNFFTLIMLYFYYAIGRDLEHAWGAFRYNLYLLSGIIFTFIGALLMFLIYYFPGGLYAFPVQETAATFAFLAGQFSTYYICMSILLAFAITYPDVRIMFMFVIPLKVKVLGIVYVVILGYEVLISAISGNYAAVIAIVFSLLNALIFFLITRKSFRTPTQIKRQRAYKKSVEQFRPKRNDTRHKCAICGRTESDGEHLEFRYCSKCEGNYEYCPEHLFTHVHVKKQ